MENPNKDVDTKSSEDTNIQRTNKIPQKKQVKRQQSNTIPLKNSPKIFEESNNKTSIIDCNIDINNKNRWQQNNRKVSFLFINKTLGLNNLKTARAMNTKISVFVICAEAIIYLFLY